MGQGDLHVKGNLTIDGKDHRPVGEITMFAGTWIDNVTMVGWYACTAGNSGHGCPDLVDKFVMGGAASGASGGENSKTLAEAEMPQHTHTGTTANQSASHTHSFSSAHAHGLFAGYTLTSWGGSGPRGVDIQTRGADVNTKSGTASGTTGNQSASHTHTITTDNTGSSTAFDNRPAYYTVIFIRKCY